MTNVLDDCKMKLWLDECKTLSERKGWNKMTIMLKSLRKGKRMTQERLAKILHISQTTVSKYESGEIFPDLETTVKMADFFGVSLDDFIIR